MSENLEEAVNCFYLTKAYQKTSPCYVQNLQLTIHTQECSQPTKIKMQPNF